MADNFLTDQQFDKLVSGLSAAFTQAMTSTGGSGGGVVSPAMVRIEEERRELIKENLENLKEFEELERKIKADAVERASDLIELGEKELTKKERNLILAEELVKEQKEYYKVAKESGILSEEEIKDLREKLKLAIKIRNEKKKDRDEEKRDKQEADKRQRDINTEFKFQADQILSRFVGIDNKTRQTAKTLNQMGGFGNYFKGTLAKSAELLGDMNVGTVFMVKLFEKLKDSAEFVKKMSLEGVSEGLNLTSNIEKATRRQDEFRKTARDINVITGEGIEELGQRFMRLGRETRGTTEDFMRIEKSLFEASNAFRQLQADGDNSRETLEKTAFLLERRFNINVADTGKALNILSQSFGKTVPQVNDFQKTLAATASTLGLNVKTVVADFAAAANNLSRFGLPDIQREFLSLSVVAQKTGLSIDQVTSSLEKFSTFEGALSAASKLNAVFGTTIDGMEIMEEFNLNGPLSALIKLREGLEQTGRSFKDLNFSEMRVFEQALGLNSLQMKAFGEVSVEELRKIQNETKGLGLAEVEKVLKKGRDEAELSAEKRLQFLDKSVTAMDKAGKLMDNNNRSVMDFANSMSESMNQLSQILVEIADLIKIGLIGGMLGFIGKTVMATTAVANLGKAQALTNVAGGYNLTKGIGASLLGVPGLGLAVAGIGAGMMIEGTELDPFEKKGGGSSFDRAGDIKVRGGVPGFQSELNFASKDYQTATVAEGDNAEIIALRQQTMPIPAGASISQLNSAGQTSVNLTVNLVTKEGKTIESTNIAANFGENELNKAITTYLNNNLNLARNK